MLEDERGAIAVYIALILPFLVGLSLLVIDGSRLLNLDTSLQNNVDALALAGAAELDRRPDSHVRACRAMSQLLSNEQVFVTGSKRLTVTCAQDGRPGTGSDITWRWLRSIQPDVTTLQPAETFFIEVTSIATAADFAMIFPVSFIGTGAPGGLSKTAVAGMSRIMCKPTPLMMCNPWEAQGITDVAALRGRIGWITTAREYGGGGAAIGPGNFGLVDPGQVVDSCNTGGSSGQIVQTLTWQLAGQDPGICEIRNGICPKTGVVASLDKAVNSRFDIYEGPIGSFLSNNPAALVPAARTIWNATDAGQNGCQRSSIKEASGEVASGVWYPREQNWNRTSYFSQYTELHPTLNSNTAAITLADGTQKQLGQLTRHETYLWETQRASSSPVNSRPYSKPAENTCFSSKVGNGLTILQQIGLSGRTDRRDVYVSLLNCIELQNAIAAGAPYSFAGASSDLPLPSFALGRFFITEPVNRTFSSAGLDFDGKARQSSTGGGAPSAWPTATCPLPSGYFSFYFDLTNLLVAGRTYFLQRPSAQTLEATLPIDQPATMSLLVQLFNQQAAAITDSSKTYLFCQKTGSNLLFVATPETSNTNSLTFGLDIPGAGKRIFMELVNVLASDNGAGVTRDVVRLYR